VHGEINEFVAAVESTLASYAQGRNLSFRRFSWLKPVGWTFLTSGKLSAGNGIEDHIRQLIYDLKQWQSIESTGRGGADDGFDIRAYEILLPSVTPVDEGAEEDAPHPMDGNLWMIQCKREKAFGPKRIEAIIGDGDCS